MTKAARKFLDTVKKGSLPLVEGSTANEERESDAEQGARFLQTLFARCAKGYIEFRPLPVGDDRKWVPVNNIQVPKLPEGKNIYVGVATRHDKKGTKADIIEIPAVWADVDFKQTQEEEVLKRLKDFPLKPSIHVRSGGGYHLYWVLEKPAEVKDIGQIEDINRRLADYFGGDKAAAEAAHILRLPGTMNMKYDPSRPVILSSAQTIGLYNLGDFAFLPLYTERSNPKGMLSRDDDILKGVPEGQRHYRAAYLVGHYLGKKLAMEEIYHIMNSWNQNNQPPLPDKELETIINGIHKKHIRDHVQGASNSKGKARKEKQKLIFNMTFPELIDVVIDDNDDNEDIVFLVASPSGIQVLKSWMINNENCFPPEKKDIPYRLPLANKVLNFITEDKDEHLFKDIQNYLLESCHLNDGQRTIATCYAFLTYMQSHPDIHYLPILLFYAVPERGKSRAGKALTYISYRGIPSVDLREANLFRYSQDYNATVFFDVMDLKKKVEQGQSLDLLLSRYERGAKVARVLYPDRGPFSDMKFFDVYGPTIIATNEEVHRILDTRCILITMENKPGVYKNITPGDAVELKERLVAWRARNMNTPLPDVELVDGIQGRLWDISKPLLQVCKRVSPNHYDILVSALLEVAGYRIDQKRNSYEGKIIAAIYDLSPNDTPEWKLSTADVLEEVNLGIDEKYRSTSQGLGRKLKQMGIRTSTATGRSKILINRDELDLLVSQYGIQTVSNREDDSQDDND
jgi:hypothetical protein